MQCTVHWCSSLSDGRAGGPETGLLPRPPCPPGWPRRPGLPLGGGKKETLRSPVLSVLLSWTVNTTKVIFCCSVSERIVSDIAYWSEWKLQVSFFYCDICLCLVVEVVWQTRVTEAQLGISAATLALCKCQRWHTGNTGEAPRCVSAFGLFSQSLWCVRHCSSSSLLYTFQHINMKAKEPPTWKSLWQHGYSSVKTEKVEKCGIEEILLLTPAFQISGS